MKASCNHRKHGFYARVNLTGQCDLCLEVGPVSTWDLCSKESSSLWSLISAKRYPCIDLGSMQWTSFVSNLHDLGSVQWTRSILNLHDLVSMRWISSMWIWYLCQAVSLISIRDLCLVVVPARINLRSMQWTCIILNLSDLGSMLSSRPCINLGSVHLKSFISNIHDLGSMLWTSFTSSIWVLCQMESLIWTRDLCQAMS